MRRAFTLVELMVVVIIAGILASIAVPTYINTNEKAKDKEAITMLKNIRTAERQFFTRTKGYFPGSGVTENGTTVMNDWLGLFLNENVWDYQIVGRTNGFNARASRVGRTWLINETANDPVCAGSCL